ncbi:sodium:solute symporter [Pelagibacteraceae bacterium]|nr:sodium:solute symporter [Pelagibacteraceae bacterium]
MKKNLLKGSLFTVGASLWWGVIGVLYFKFVSFASALELTIHRTIWTALLLLITTTYFSKWKEFNKIIKKKNNLIIFFFTGLLISINWFTWLYGALGYYIFPILSVFFGIIFLKEKYNRNQVISQVPLWITAGVTLIICLLYILRGGFALSIITDKYQFAFIVFIILASLLIILSDIDLSSFEIIKKNSPNLIDKNYLPNYTAGLTFFIAVAATNLFHQGNWQRVFSARNNSTLKSSLIYSSIIIFFIVFWMGYSGLLSYSLNPKVIPDLAFFDLILSEKNSLIIIGILILAMSLTLSTIDTLINAISSLIIVNGNQINKNLSGKKVKDQANIIILLLCVLVFLLASKGYSILYLFLLADLLCCAAVITIFYGFFNKKINSKLAAYSIICGLLSGLLFFPSQNYQSSILVGNLINIKNFSILIQTNLLFVSFVISLIVPFVMILTYSLRNSFK